MPELPEIRNLAAQMDRELRGRSIVSTVIRQEKCLNVPADEFRSVVVRRPIERVDARGKWLHARLGGDAHLLVSLGMGGELIYHPRGEDYTGRHQFRMDLDDGSFLHIYFSWFGYVHVALGAAGLAGHQMTARLGADPLSPEFTLAAFSDMLKGRRGGIKSFLMDQRNIAGIGNVYIQDILYQAGLHPDRRIATIDQAGIARLRQAIVSHLQHATELGGLKWELDLYGQPGRYEYRQVGHRPGEPCPGCGAEIVAIRTGGTRSYICPVCQV
jgi:formamidopyrimidine-DNA glycosylase